MAEDQTSRRVLIISTYRVAEAETPPTPPGKSSRILLITDVRNIALASVVLILSLFYLRDYARIYQPEFGWTKLIMFGKVFADNAIPRVQRNDPYLDPTPERSSGYDGQFYAQLAIDPSLKDPAFPWALDNPVYRARRIGLPAIAFCLGWGKPRWVLQVYALSNLLFWFLFVGALTVLLRPWTGKQLLCFSGAALSWGVIESMERSLVDLPSAAFIFAGLVLGSWGSYGAMAAAALTRETSLIAAVGVLDVRNLRSLADWMRRVGMLAIAIVPLAIWFAYVHHQLQGGQSAAGNTQNFAWPFAAMGTRFAAGWEEIVHHGFTGAHPHSAAWFLYAEYRVNVLLTIATLFFQGLFLCLRPNWQSPIWRIGAGYLLLCVTLGAAVWDHTAAAARVMIPMTTCFYLLLAQERSGWRFWVFFVLGSLSVPYAVHDFWMLS